MLYHKTYLHPTSTKWVTFVHGAGGSSSVWYKQIKYFKSHYNVLLLDLRGHGKSKMPISDKIKRYSFKGVSDDVIQVLDHLKIRQSYFVGISLGTIIIREIAERYADKVEGVIMAGAVMKLNFKSQFLMKMGALFKSVLPYMALYRLFAFVILPRANHKESRNLFIQEAKKLYRKEFLRWYSLTADVNPLLKFFRSKELNIPTLYLMGSEDHLFLPVIRKMVKVHTQAQLLVVPRCGHVVNVEQPIIFNEWALGFLQKLDRGTVSE